MKDIKSYGEFTVSVKLYTGIAASLDIKVEEYEEKLRTRISDIVSQIKGVGEAGVSLTLEGGIEYVYVKDEKSDTEIRGSNTDPVSKSSSSEEKVILVEDENGHKTALIQRITLPKVQGVVIVCDGGDDIEVVSAVTEAVKTALGIKSTQVCVIKRG